MARAKSLMRPRSTVTAKGGYSLPTMSLLIWIGISGEPASPRGSRSWRVLVPRDDEELQAHPDQQRLDESQEHAVGHAVEEAAAEPGAREHHRAQSAPDDDGLPGEQRVSRERRGACGVHAQGADRVG